MRRDGIQAAPERQRDSTRPVVRGQVKTGSCELAGRQNSRARCSARAPPPGGAASAGAAAGTTACCLGAAFLAPLLVDGGGRNLLGAARGASGLGFAALDVLVLAFVLAGPLPGHETSPWRPRERRGQPL